MDGWVGGWVGGWMDGWMEPFYSDVSSRSFVELFPPEAQCPGLPRYPVCKLTSTIKFLRGVLSFSIAGHDRM